MTPWPATDPESREALWRVHAALVEIRATAWAGDTSARGALLGLAEALDELVSQGLGAFEHRLRAEPVFQRALHPAQQGPNAITGAQALAFAVAMAWVVRDLANRASDLRDLAKATDELEYLPCEFLRLGPPAIVMLVDPREPAHIRELAVRYQQHLSP